MSALSFVEHAATFEPRGDNMVMTVTSGDVDQSFIFPRGAFMATMGAGARTARDWFATQQAEIVPFKPGKRSKRA